MLLIDDILLFPARSLLWIFREIHDRAVEEVANEGEAIAQQLRNLYMQLETNAITEEQFATREKKLLDRLDDIEGGSGTDLKEGKLESEDEETPAHEPDR
jgi:hypothetical protein